MEDLRKTDRFAVQQLEKTVIENELSLTYLCKQTDCNGKASYKILPE